MSDMDKLESNIYASFSRVKSDILKLSGEITKISEAMTKLAEEQGDMKENIGEMAKKVAVFNSCMRQLDKVADKATSSPKTKTVVVEKIKVKKVAAKHKKKTYVASKSGKKFHMPECIFAKNIKPKSMVKFKSKNAMLNKGYKPCVCVQK